MADTNISVDVLKVHPRNQEFFDDISGEDYEQFKSSIKEDGILVSLIVAPDMTILSGHQRFKAAKELGIKTVPVKIRDDIETDDQKLKILLAANFGRNKNDDAKRRKIAAEYVALCGYKNGGDRKAQCQNGAVLTLDEIATQLGTTKRSLQRSLRIERNLSEDMKQLLDDGVISETFAADVIAAMSEEDQMKFIASLDVTKKYTANELKKLADENQLLKSANSKLKESNDKQSQAVNNVSTNETNKDLEAALELAQSAESEKNDIKKKYDDLIEESKADKEKITSLTEELDGLLRANHPHLAQIEDTNEIYAFCGKCTDLAKSGGDLIYSTAFAEIDVNSTEAAAISRALGRLQDMINDISRRLSTGDYEVVVNY